MSARNARRLAGRTPRCLAAPMPRPPFSRREKLGIVVRDWWHVAGAMARAVLDRTPADAFTTGERAPVILIPGIWEPWRFLLPLARRLHACGHPVHPLPALGFNGRSLDESLRRVRRDLDRLGLRGAVLVAHSKGGMIGTLLLADAEAGEHLRGMVAVCSPLAGSSLASPLLGPVLHPTPLGMFTPGGADVRRITEAHAVADRVVSLASAWDEMVPTGSHLPGARNHTLNVPGHFLPVDDAGVARVVCAHVAALAGDAPDVPR